MPKQQSTREAINDGVIAARVKAALLVDPLTVPYDIHVETLAGIVELSGFVETTLARDAALQLAQKIEGVQQVHDSLDIRATH
ncbi:MAG TPA: BON domain-containing protein [Povalibacter sp.]|nr:BON domain-containing protein [Povalibacter sp.]